MGFQGQLSSVNLTDIFQTLNMNRQTGTLTVTGPSHTVRIYFDQGNIVMCSGPLVNGRPYLLDVLAHKGQLSTDKIDDLMRQQAAGGHTLRDLVLASGMVADYELDEITAAAIEELVCPVFEWQEGDFTFLDGPPAPELVEPEAVVMGGAVVQTTQLVMEATRRMDEWKRIREVITDLDAFYIVDNDGRANLKNVQTDPDMLKVLRYLDGRHLLDAIALAVGVTRFDTYAIVAQLALAGVARARTAQEIVEDAVGIMQQGDIQQASELLESCLKQSAMPEVMRPLAECCVKLNQAPRAVELYLELIQMGQDQGDLAQALKDLDTVIELSPDDPDLHFERGQVQAELGEVEPAATSYATAAQAYLSRKDLARAVDACHRAKNLLPRAPEPHRYLARAYLLEGQTENAVVEYKSLWHALLTAERPKAAFETLKGILETDCKYNNVKDQVLSHAQNSEAIKTSKAARMLVYLLIVFLILAGSFAAYSWWEKNIVTGKGSSQISSIESDLPKRMAILEHATVLKELDELKSQYNSIGDLRDRIDEIEKRVKEDYNLRAEAQYTHAETLEQNRSYDEAEAAVMELKQRYQGTPAATRADTLLDTLHAAKIAAQVEAQRTQAEVAWRNGQWEQALGVLEGILARKDLPPRLFAELTTEHADWKHQTESSEQLFKRAQTIEDSGNKKDALLAYRLASKGQGQEYVDRARARVLALELDLAHELGRTAQLDAQRGDDEQTFASVDRLEAMAREAWNREVGDYVSHLELPYTLVVDDPHVEIAIHRSTGEEAHVTAPPGRRGTWSHTFAYRVEEAVSVSAARTGFAATSFQVSIKNRHTQSAVALVRGPRWHLPLSGMATTRPVSTGQLVLIGTDKSSVEIIEPVTAADHPWQLPPSFNNLSTFDLPPVLFGDKAYVAIAEHIFAIDLGNRTAACLYPGPDAGERFTGALWIQNHPIQADALLIAAPIIKDGVELLELNNQGQVKAYPRLLPGTDITGAPLIDHINAKGDRYLLYVPTSGSLHVFDVSSATSDSSPPELDAIESHGDLVGMPIKARVLGRDAILVADRTGSVIAVDADPNVPMVRRLLKSWVLGGTDPSSPILDAARSTCYVTTSPGRLSALDLRGGQALWQFPPQGQPGLGDLPGTPAVGRLGVYIADGHGILHCIDSHSGAERWQAAIGAAPSGGLLVQDGSILVPLKNGQLLCFDEGDE